VTFEPCCRCTEVAEATLGAAAAAPPACAFVGEDAVVGVNYCSSIWAEAFQYGPGPKTECPGAPLLATGSSPPLDIRFLDFDFSIFRLRCRPWRLCDTS